MERKEQKCGVGGGGWGGLDSFTTNRPFPIALVKSQKSAGKNG